MKVKNAKTNIGKGSLNCNLVNIIKDNNPKTPKRANKNKKHNNNTFKNINNKTKCR